MSITPQVRHELTQARGQVWAKHSKDPNFTGCGIGYRRRDGVVTDEPVVIAMVVDKLPAGALSSRRLLPASVRVNGTDYGVDVVEAGPVYANGTLDRAAPQSVTSSGPVTGPYRPLVQGCGISNSGVATSSSSSPTIGPAGTLGCFVTSVSGAVVIEFLLSAGHILAGGPNLWSPSNLSNTGNIVQPAVSDQVLTGTTYQDPVAEVTYVSPLDTTPGSLANTVDWGVAQLNTDYGDTTFAKDLMPPISDGHPAVGMCVGSDAGGNSYLARMDATLQQVGLPMVGMFDVTDGTAAPQVGMHIEKVGRSSGYTSSTVDATDVIVTINYVDPVANALVPVTMSGIIWSQYFTIAGDSGAVACQGGDGQTYVLPPRAPCPLTQAVQGYYNLPSNISDNTLTNNVQAKVLTQTLAGNLLIGLVYMNQQTVISRLGNSTGPAYNQATAQAFFQQLYAKYRPVVVGLLTNPSSFTFTQAMATDYGYALNMLGQTPANGGQGILTSQEYGLGVWLMFTVAGLAQNNYTYQQIQALLDNPLFYDQACSAIASIPTITLP